MHAGAIDGEYAGAGGVQIGYRLYPHAGCKTLIVHFHGNAELAARLAASFGDRTRIDYGTGHELSFLVWLRSLDRLGLTTPAERPATVLVLLQRFSEAADARIYVVQEPGPTSFVLKSADSERKHRVSIGSVHSCSCGAREQPCVHTSFVLLRIFRLPAGDQRAWQGGLLDSELERIIEFSPPSGLASVSPSTRVSHEVSCVIAQPVSRGGKAAVPAAAKLPGNPSVGGMPATGCSGAPGAPMAS